MVIFVGLQELFYEFFAKLSAQFVRAKAGYQFGLTLMEMRVDCLAGKKIARKDSPEQQELLPFEIRAAIVVDQRHAVVTTQ